MRLWILFDALGLPFLLGLYHQICPYISKHLIFKLVLFETNSLLCHCRISIVLKFIIFLLLPGKINFGLELEHIVLVLAEAEAIVGEEVRITTSTITMENLLILLESALLPSGEDEEVLIVDVIPRVVLFIII